MAADRTITTRMRVDIGQYVQGMTAAERATARTAKAQEEIGRKSKAAEPAARSLMDKISSPQAQRAGVGLLAVGTAITGIGVAAAKTGISYNQLQQQTRAALGTVLGSAEAANAQMDRLDAFARTSPFAKQVFITAQQQMLAFGIETQKVIPYLDAMQDAIAASGGSSQMLSEVAFVISQISAAGKITAEDLNQLGQRGINAAELIGSQMGKTGQQIREDISNGAIGADQALDALTAGMEQRFDGAAENVKNTFGGALDRVSAAWRDLSSALAEPLVGKEGGGLATSGLNTVADLLRNIEALPGPAKAASAAVAGLIGAGSLGAGGFLLLAPRIAETRAAAKVLATDMPRTTRALRGLGAAGIAAAAGLATLTAADALRGMASGDLADASDAMSVLANRFEVSGRIGGVVAKTFGHDLSDLGDQLKRFRRTADDNTLTRTLRGFTDFGQGWEDSQMAENIRRMDEALVSLSQVDPSSAAKAFDELSSAAQEQGATLNDVTGAFPKFNSLLKEGAKESRTLGVEQATTADKLNHVSEATKAQIDAQKKAAEALKEYQGEIRDSSTAFVDFAGATKDGERSVDEWIDKLQKMLKAQRRWGNNLEELADRGASQALLDQLRGMGVDGAQYVQALADGSDKDIKRLNKVLRGSRKEANQTAEALTDLGETDAKPEVKVKGTDKARGEAEALNSDLGRILMGKPYDAKVGVTGIGPAMGQIRTFADHVNATLNSKIKDEPVNIYLTPQARDLLGVLPKGLQPGFMRKATGGAVFGPGTGTSDDIPAWLSNNEHVVTDAEVRAAGKGSSSRGHRVIESIRRMIMRGELGKMGDAPAFASGGPVIAAHGGALGPAVSSVSSQFGSIAAAISAMLSQSVSKGITYTPPAGQLGEGGTLTPSQVLRGQRFVQSQAGKPYGWGMVGPSSYDCSGLISAATNAVLGTALHVRRGATGSMPWGGFRGGLGGSLDVGWFTGNPGHTAGTLGGVNIESSGGVGVRFGGPRGAGDGMFNRHMNMADGGFVSGPGGPRSDSIPAMLSNGEFVVNAESTRIFSPLLESINGYAAGGKVSGKDRKALAASAREFQITVSMDTADVRREVKSLLGDVRGIVGKSSGTFKALDRMTDRLVRTSRALDTARGQIDKEKETRSGLLDDLKSYREGIVSNLTHDPFEGGLGDFDTQLAADRNDAARRANLQAQLRKKGLGGKNDKGGLADDVFANASNEFLAELLRSGSAGIRRRELAYAGTNNQIASTAYQASQGTTMQREVAQSSRAIKKLERTTDRLERTLKGLPRDIRSGLSGTATKARNKR